MVFVIYLRLFIHHLENENFKYKTRYIMALTLSHLPFQNFLPKSELHKPGHIFPYKPSYF